MKNTRKLFLIGLALVSAALISLRLPIKEGFFEMSKQLEIMNSAFRELNIFYVDPLSPGELMETGIAAMLKSLDPYTRYYPESKMEDVRFMSTGEYGGVGLSLNERWDGTFYVVDLKENAPAEQSGIKLGDNLIQIAGSNISHLDMSKIGELIKGTAGTDITLGIQKPSQKKLVNITLTREKIKQPDVPYFGMISDSTGYLILSKFTRTATIEVRKALIQLTDSMGAKQIVFDLRGNGGGLLREAVNIVNLFVPKGQEVVSMRGKTPEWNKSYSTSQKALLPNIPLVILLDERSASASEIVAGTLQDIDRAVIIGQESFGKGLVQQTKKLAYGSRIKITVAKYYTASGRCVQRLHYDDRDDSGDARISADSTLITYYTKNGRPVIEGRGVIPDIELKPQTQDYVIEGLVNSGVFFDFVVNTSGDIDDSIDLDSFEISDSQWESFLNYTVEQFNDQVLQNTDRAFPYEPLSKKLIVDLETAMNEDGLIGDESIDNSELISNLKTLIKPNLEVDLTSHEDDIRQVLGKEFVFHLENTSGVFKFELPKDKVALEAISTLESGNYLQILSGNTNN
ncbi:MAG TPA: S41 family peptidase [Flavobacteriales bacterium]|nr:S41 family peptidase [Flavobacteriales bacterium]